jgi:hypothetical protein
MKISGAFKAIWRGPFFVGPLARPISLGDALAKLFEVFWKGGVLLICGILAILAATIGWPEIDRYTHTDLTKKVEVAVSWDPKVCSQRDLPLKVVISNNSKLEIGRVGFHIAARKINRSTDLNTNFTDSYSDAIIAPGYWLIMCYSMPLISDDDAGQPISYSAEVHTVDKYDGPYTGPLPPSMNVSAPPIVRVTSR